MRTARARPRRRPDAAVAGAVLLGTLFALALLAPWLAPYDPQQIAGAPATRPSAQFRMGTNALGQDLLSHLLHGGRTSLLIGALTAAIATALSAVMGIAAGLWPRGRGVLLGIIDLFLAIPNVPIVVLLIVFLGPGFWSLVAALVLVGWAGFARIVFAQVRSTLQKDYVGAATALGATTARIVRSGVLPEVGSILFTKLLLTVRWAVLMEATLGLLGLADPARVSWGLVLNQAFGYSLLFVTDAWIWWAGPPALAIVLTSLGLMAIGQDLDHWLNPHAVPGSPSGE